MSIDRLSGKNPKQPDGLKASSSGRSDRKSEAAAPRTTGQATPTDQVRISSEVHASADSQDVPRGEISAERLQQLGERMASGFYDSAEVVDLVPGASCPS